MPLPPRPHTGGRRPPPARVRRAARSRGMHQAGRDLFAEYLRLFPHAARGAAHEAFDVAPYRYNTTVKADAVAVLCVRFVLPAGDGGRRALVRGTD